jgi:transcription elongation factor GreA
VTRPGAADLLRGVGLLADGPSRWGQPVAGRGPGLYIVELPAPLPSPSIDLAAIGRWIEHVPNLRLDGARPTGKALAARLAAFWLGDASVIYAGATRTSIGGRVAALGGHVLGEPRGHADGQWLHVLRELPTTRVWWAATSAPEEYLDAVLEAFAAAGPVVVEAGTGRPAGALLLPWANLRRPTGERQATGITGSVLPLPPEPPKPGTRVVEVPAGDADGARLEERGTGTRRRVPSPGAEPARARTAATRRRGASSGSGGPPVPGPVEVTPEAHAAMLAELDVLTRVRRPEVVARIKSARELGDLRENAEYHAAREEQSFLEGRVQLLEQRLRRAVIVETAGGATTGRATLGSRMTVETGGDELTYTLVGSTEANPAAGRISTSSPVGSALLGSVAGSEVTVRTPRGDVRYRVVSVE